MITYNNVPNDWNCYWNKCSDCGGKYHASEGGCGCEDEKDDQETGYWKRVQARKARLIGTKKEIRPGDTVAVYSGFMYIIDGPRTGYFRNYYRKVKGPNWD